MLHAAFWGIGLLSMLCLVAFAAAQGARHGRGEAFLWAGAVSLPVLCLAGWGIAFIAGQQAKGCHPLWLAYVGGWAIAFIAGTAAVLARAVRRGPGGALAGASWSRVRLLWTGVFGGLLAEQMVRVMDRAQLAALAAEVPAWRREAISLLARPEVPPEENAAPLYQDAIHLLETRKQDPHGGVEDDALLAGFDGGGKDARDRLEELDEVVRLLREASGRPAIREPIDIDAALESSSDRQFMRMSLLLVLDARVKAASGSPDEAFAAAIRLWRLAGHVLEAGTGSSDLLEAVYIARMAVSTLENVIADAGGLGPTGEIPSWPDIPFEEEIARLLRCDRLLERIRWGALGERVEKAPPPDPDLPPHLGRASLERFLDATNRRLYRAFVLPGALERPWGDLGKAIEIVAREAEAVERLARAGLAAAAHRARRGEYPARLEELVPDLLGAVPLDPFGGKPLRLAAVEGGIVIYSVGHDGSDEGGAELDAGGRERDIAFRLGGAYEVRRERDAEHEKSHPPAGEAAEE
jgi:hypothetical protein